MRTVELLIDEEQEDFGVEAISLVKFPAIEENFVYFNKDQKLTLAKVDEDKQLLVGPALIPDKMIPRWDESKQEEFEVYFSTETVQQAAELFMRQKRNGEYTVEHQTKVDGLSIFESWIVADKDRDKAAVYGFDVPEGFGTCHQRRCVGRCQGQEIPGVQHRRLLHRQAREDGRRNNRDYRRRRA